MRARPPAVLHPPVSTGSAGRAARRLLLAFLVSAAAFSGGDAAVLTPQAPAITEPAFDDETVSAYDVHMVAGPFVGAPGENHVCTDWEIRTPYSDQIAWFASCVTGVLKVHIHLGDGAFTGPLAGQHQLETDSYYKLRVRFQGDAGPPESRWSDWAERMFHTAAGSAIQPLVLSEIAVIRSPTWRDEGSEDVVLPAGMPAPSVRLEVAGVGPLLVFEGLDGARNDVSNLPPLATHGPLHVAVSSGGADLALPASQVAFTDGSGEDRDVFLPPITLPAGQTAGFWISEGGGAFTADPAPGPGAEPVFGDPVSEPPVPWAVKQPGFRVDRVATGFQLPVNIAFVPNPGAAAGDPFYYVTELYGAVKVVTRGGEVSDYATDLLNFDPTGSFPGSGEKGLAGIVVEPATGDLFVSGVEAVPPVTDFHFPRVIRLHSEDGGLTAASQTTVLDFPDEPLGPSHQISNLTIGPDDKLYVHIGDGLLTTPAQDLTSVRGKILRVNLDGSAPADNPYYDASDGITATDLVFAYGFRNPFGGAWRATDGAHWEVENGPGVDRLAKVVAGRNYLWDGTDASMSNFASYVWPQSVAPVNIVFVQPATFLGSGFPDTAMDHAFVSESGATYAPGPQSRGKRVSEFTLSPDGTLVSGPSPLIEYVGAGRGTVTALAAGPDGLYFADLYKDFGATTPIDRGASIFRIRYTGVADFSAEEASGPVPLAVSFQDGSDVPGAAAWHWEFGDGTSSDERNPVHQYLVPGAYDVRLTVSGPAGDAVRQKAGFVAVTPALRQFVCCFAPRPGPRTLPPR
jgi:glucose/arabinose dehydrogenase